MLSIVVDNDSGRWQPVLPAGGEPAASRRALPCWSRPLSQPQDSGDGLGVADPAIYGHPGSLRQWKKLHCNSLIGLGLRFAGVQTAREIDGHGFVEKTRAHVKMQNP